MTKIIKIAEKKNNNWMVTAIRRKGHSLDLTASAVMPGNSSWHELLNCSGTAYPEPIDAVVVDNLALACYQLELPGMTIEQLNSAIDLQMEASLPVAADKVILSRMISETRNNKHLVGIAAVNKRQLENLTEYFGTSAPRKVILKPQAVLAGFKAFCPSVPEKNYAVLYVDSHQTIYTLECYGIAADMVVYDFGYSELFNQAGQLNQALAEQLTQGLYYSREHYPFISENFPTYVISDGSRMFEQLSGYMISQGLNGQTCIIEQNKLIGTSTDDQPFNNSYHELVKAGATEILSGDLACYEIFQSQIKQEQKPAFVWPPVWAACLVLLLSGGLYLYSSDLQAKSREKHLTNYIEGKLAGRDMLALQKENQIRNLVAKRRTDILTLLTDLNEINPGQIKMNGLICNIGKPVVFDGSANPRDKMYEFQSAITKSEKFNNSSLYNIKKVNDQEATFTIEFNYGPFGKQVK